MEGGIPKKIGRYLIDRLLGSGAMGHVYLGRDPDLDRPVAIKTVRNLEMDEEAFATFLERFRNEARAAARLHHPNIVQVYDVGEEEGVGPYLVFEYVAGATLKRLLREKGALPPAGVVRLAEEVADALEVAHEAGIIHRDIKPDNLLVTPEGQTKLADFGVARIPNAALTREGQFLGTPCYAAPETLKAGAYGVRSDLFSFAAVLYEAAAGRRAFPGLDAVAVAHKVIHDEPSALRSVADESARIPKSVEALIHQGLSKDPEERFGSAAEMAAAVAEAYVAAGLVHPADFSRPPSRRVPLAPKERRSSGALAFAALLAGGLAVGVGLIFAFDDSGGDPRMPVAADAGLDAGRAARVVVRDAGQAAPLDAPADVALAVTDTGVDAPDSSAPPCSNPHDCEEAGKEALTRARQALRDGDPEAARAALDEARRFDPENPDIAALAREL